MHICKRVKCQDSHYVKTVGVLMPSKWGCGGQEVPEGGHSVQFAKLTTFVKGSPPKIGSNYVKTRNVLMPPKWGCGGQEVPEGGF